MKRQEKQRLGTSLDWDPYDPTYKKYLHIGRWKWREVEAYILYSEMIRYHVVNTENENSKQITVFQA